MTECAYKIGDVIWAKMKGYPPWPARIAAPNETNIRNNDAEKSKSAKPYYLVYFFGSNNYAWMPEDTLKPYQEFAEEYKKKTKKTAGFTKGLKAIDEYMRKVEDGTLTPPPEPLKEEEEDEEEEGETNDIAPSPSGDSLNNASNLEGKFRSSIFYKPYVCQTMASCHLREAHTSILLPRASAIVCIHRSSTTSFLFLHIISLQSQVLCLVSKKRLLLLRAKNLSQSLRHLKRPNTHTILMMTHPPTPHQHHQVFKRITVEHHSTSKNVNQPRARTPPIQLARRNDKRRMMMNMMRQTSQVQPFPHQEHNHLAKFKREILSPKGSSKVSRQLLTRHKLIQAFAPTVTRTFEHRHSNSVSLA